MSTETRKRQVARKRRFLCPACDKKSIRTLRGATPRFECYGNKGSEHPPAEMSWDRDWHPPIPI